MGLRGSSTVQGVSGPLIIEDLAAACEADPDLRFPVFTWDGHQITVGLAYDCRLVGEEQVFGILLDSGETVYCSSSTFFITRKFDEKIAPELKPGDSLLPLYLGKDAHGYPVYKQIGDYKFAPAPVDRCESRKVGRMVAEWKLGRPLTRGVYVEYADGNAWNCHPDNIAIKENATKATKSKGYTITDAVRRAQQLVEGFEKRTGRKIGGNNHTVHDVQPLELEPVYELRVESTDVVAAEGVFLRLGA